MSERAAGRGFAELRITDLDLLEQESQQLTQLRDWLLPMLINGQVKVA